MTPEEIKHHFGEDNLNLLYDCILDRAVHELADWILMYHDERQIAEWLVDLKQDMEGDV